MFPTTLYEEIKNKIGLINYVKKNSKMGFYEHKSSTKKKQM